MIRYPLSSFFTLSQMVHFKMKKIIEFCTGFGDLILVDNFGLSLWNRFICVNAG